MFYTTYQQLKLPGWYWHTKRTIILRGTPVSSKEAAFKSVFLCWFKIRDLGGYTLWQRQTQQTFCIPITRAVISITENNPATNYKLSKIPYHQSHYINVYLHTETHTHTQTRTHTQTHFCNECIAQNHWKQELKAVEFPVALHPD